MKPHFRNTLDVEGKSPTILGSVLELQFFWKLPYHVEDRRLLRGPSPEGPST